MFQTQKVREYLVNLMIFMNLEIKDAEVSQISEKSNTKTTLIGTKLAKVGLDFIFKGDLCECNDCKLKSVCMNLEEDSKYKIIKVRNKVQYDCAIHDENVVVVEVLKLTNPKNSLKMVANLSSIGKPFKQDKLSTFKQYKK